MTRRSRYCLFLTLAVGGCSGTPSAPTPPAETAPAQTSGAAPVAVVKLTVDSLGSLEAVAAVSEVMFDAGESTGTRLRYRIDFGDGSVGSDRLARHVYAAPGTYHVTVTVTDEGNRTATTTRDVVVGSPLGLWVHSGYFARINRVEVRSLAITAQDGATLRGVLTKDSTGRTPFNGVITADRRVRFTLEGTTESLEGAIPSMLTSDGSAWPLALRGGALDGESSTFRRVVGEAVGPPPAASLRMRFFSFGAPFAVKQISPVLFDGSNSRGEDLTYYIEFGDGQVVTAQTATHPLDQQGHHTARLTVVDRFGRSNTESTSYWVEALNSGGPDLSYYWLGSSDACQCVATVGFYTQQGTGVTGTHDVTLRGFGGSSRSSVAGTVSSAGDVQLAMAGSNITLSGRMTLPGEGVYSRDNSLILTFRGGPHDGVTITLHPYSSY